MTERTVTPQDNTSRPVGLVEKTEIDPELQEIDDILGRLETGIAQEKDAMDSLLSKLRTSPVIA